jgi:hypothetical protein
MWALRARKKVSADALRDQKKPREADTEAKVNGSMKAQLRIQRYSKTDSTALGHSCTNSPNHLIRLIQINLRKPLSTRVHGPHIENFLDFISVLL